MWCRAGARAIDAGPQVAGKSGFLGVGGLGKVLILAREEIVAALLGLMVELQGLDPLHLAKTGIAEDVIRRELPSVLVIDCDDQDCTDLLLAAIRDAGAKPVLFSPFRFASEVKRVASDHGVEYFGSSISRCRESPRCSASY